MNISLQENKFTLPTMMTEGNRMVMERISLLIKLEKRKGRMKEEEKKLTMETMVLKRKALKTAINIPMTHIKGIRSQKDRIRLGQALVPSRLHMKVLKTRKTNTIK